MAESYHKLQSQFCIVFTRSVIAWNRAEDAARRILQALTEGGIGSMCAITHLGSRGIDDSLLSVADYYDDPETPNLQEVGTHVKHYVDGLGVLRGYRNFYVHSLHSMGQENKPEGRFVGRLAATEAKGRFAWVNQRVTDLELQEFMQHCERLQKYGEGIALYVQKDNALLNALGPRPKKLPLSSLEKPQWPAQVKKSRTYLIERSPQQKPSAV